MHGRKRRIKTDRSIFQQGRLSKLKMLLGKVSWEDRMKETLSIRVENYKSLKELIKFCISKISQCKKRSENLTNVIN